MNGIVYVSSMMNNENSRLKPNGLETCNSSEDSNSNSKKQEIDFLQEDENHLSSEEETEQPTTELETRNESENIIEPLIPQVELPKVKNDNQDTNPAITPLKCAVPTCSVRLKKASSLAYHASCHNSTPQLQCPECKWSCLNWRTMQTHLWQEHKVDIDMYACDKCEYKTHSLSKLNNIHRLIHGDTKPYLCDDCGKGFKNPKQLRNHKLIHK